MLRRVCRDCKVLVDRFSFYTPCNGYSATVGRRCTGAWEQSKWLSALIILRLSHYSRLFHICRFHFFSELMMMVSGALSGMRAIGCSVILVSLPVHVTATLSER